MSDIKTEDSALAEFTEYFVTNYPTNCIIGKPEWHAPKIFRAAKYAIEQAAPQHEGEAATRVADEVMVQRLAIHMATKESANCTTLDAAVNHVNNWKRLVPEAREMLQAARPDKPAEFVMNESLRSGMKKVMLENQRLRAALDFYADHNHWMSTSENHEPEMLLVAHAGDSVFIHGWDVAQRALAVNHARLGQFIDELFGEEIQAALGEGK